MNTNLKLCFLKKLVNLSTILLDAFLKKPATSQQPQTVMLQDTFMQLHYAYTCEVQQGVFHEKNNPYGSDGNFERLLNVTEKLLLNISENDRYYRAWLGYLFILAEKTYNKQLSTASNSEIILEIKQQWLTDLHFLPDELVTERKQDFFNYSLCDYLSNHTKNRTVCSEVK